MNSSALIGGKLLSSLNAVMSTMRALEFIRDHVTFKLLYENPLC
jgi:hypothetical protein